MSSAFLKEKLIEMGRYMYQLFWMKGLFDT